MPFPVRCPACAAEFTLPDQQRGRNVVCQACQKPFRAQERSQAVETSKHRQVSSGPPAPAAAQGQIPSPHQPSPTSTIRYLVVAGLIAVVVAVVVFLLIAESTGSNEAFETTKSGLQYRDMIVGTGEEAKKGDWVRAHYVGTLQRDRSEFDNSRRRNKPFPFKLGARMVIQGWDEGVAGMKVGGKRKLVIPPALGYADQPRPKIPANSTLVFEIELMGIDKVKSTDIKEGEGPAVKAGNKVRVHYTGRLKSNGREFDSSRGKAPFAFVVGIGKVIEGWDVGLVGMKVGGQRKLEIPFPMAYGSEGDPPVIPPEADLEFDVELLAIME